jgi:hypothetical protein
MKTNRWQIMVSVALVFFNVSKLAAQDAGGANIDPAQIQQRIARFQQRMSQVDPAQLQQMAGQFLPGIAQMDPAQFQQMAEQWQQGIAQFQQQIGQVDPAQLQQMAQQWRQMAAANMGTNFNPTQLPPRQAADLREQLQVTDDTEWSVIQALIQKVMEAKRVVQADQMDSLLGQASRNAGLMAQGNRNGGLMAQANRNPGQQIPTGFAMTSPEADAVRTAIQNEASNQEIQAALTKLADARKAHLTALQKAQEDLRKVLTVRQEAVATVGGLL